jgi:hypothetical protein
MHVAYRNKKILQKEAGRISRSSLEKLLRKIKRGYPILYEEVGSQNVRKILKIVLAGERKNALQNHLEK